MQAYTTAELDWWALDGADPFAAQPEPEHDGGPGYVTVRDLMADDMRDTSDRNVDSADGINRDAGRTLKATQPWRQSLVRLGERPRHVKPVTTPMDAPAVRRFRNAADRKRAASKVTGRDKLAALEASYGGPTDVAPTDTLGPATVTHTLAHGRVGVMSCETCGRFPSHDLANGCRCVQFRERVTFEAETGYWTHWTWTDESWLPLDCSLDCERLVHRGETPSDASVKLADEDAPIQVGYVRNIEDFTGWYLSNYGDDA